VVRVDEEMRVANRRKADREEAVAKRRAARGLPAEGAAAAAPAEGGGTETEEAEVSHE